jgi:hypothetical protein
MGVERQQGRFYQPSLFEGLPEDPRPDQDGEARSLSDRHEEPQASAASDPARALSVSLMEEVTQRDNLNRAFRQVRANKGAAGVDGMTVGELSAWIAKHKDEFIASLLDGTYQPQPVRGVEIPKPGGGEITRRNRGVSFEQLVKELNSFLTGWVTYFRHAKAKSILTALGSWVRHKLRCVRLKQRKRAKSIADFLHGLGVPWNRCWTTAACGKGWWRTAQSPAAWEGMNLAWFTAQGLVNPTERYLQLQH